MAKREISSTLRNLKFMQRAVQREDKTKKEEEDVKPVGNFASANTVNRKCVVILEGDPHPGAVIGRMSFQCFNPSIDKLNEDAANIHRENTSSTSPRNNGGRKSFRHDGCLPGGAECSEAEKNSDANGDLKRKQSEMVSEPQYQNKSQKNAQGGKESYPGVNKSTGFKQPKRGKVDWSVLKPPKTG